MARDKLLLSAHVVLGAAAAGAVAYGAVGWTWFSWEPDVVLRTMNVLPLWTDAALKLSLAVMAYGLIRSLSGGARAAWFIRAGFGAALLSILVRYGYLLDRSPAELLYTANALLDIALAGLLFLAAVTLRYAVRRAGARPVEAAGGRE